MKYLIILLMAVTSCHAECPEECLKIKGNVFELNEQMEFGLNYYLSFNSENQGIVSMQFPATGKIVFNAELECQEYYLFVTKKQTTSEVSKDIQLFYNSKIDTQFVYWCSGLVNCE